MNDNILIRHLAPVPWEGDVPEKKGMLVFDKGGALMGGGSIVVADDNSVHVGHRWALGLFDHYWATRFGREEPDILVEPCAEGVIIMLKVTMQQIGNVWAENEAKWVGRMEGAMAVLDRMGIKTDGEEAKPSEGEHNGQSDFIRPTG